MQGVSFGGEFGTVSTWWIGERDGDRTKALFFTSIDNPVLAPMPAPADQLKLATRVRMKGVRDANLAVGRIHTNCSR